MTARQRIGVAELVWMLSQYSSTGVMPNAFDVDRGY